MRRTLGEWERYVYVIESELAIRNRDSNALAKIIGIIEAWQNVSSTDDSSFDYATDNNVLDAIALHAISDITDKHGGWEGL